MTTPFEVANKIDNFAVEVSIADISLLTNGLLQLQHARYPHLVPMYRTVHRTKPRAMVLRAIRWVNPKRMFPGAGKTRAEMEGMSSDDLEKLIVDLNEYRGEAHVIHNRYNQMIDLINMGELPYFIPYAGFKQDKWNMLADYMDRAQRLKDGTEQWEQVLDRQALEIRNILLKRDGADKRRLDDIKGLWVDAKGQPAAPNFMDIKKGKEKKIALRANRISADGKRVKHRQKIYVRKFIAVAPQEHRRGEQIRLPAGGNVRRPGRNNPVARKIFDEHGGAAEHLVRMPRGWAQGTNNPELREKGNMITMPAGRKDPRILTFEELDFDDVANRRKARWTQPDPLGKRGVVPHRGAASQDGHPTEDQRRFPRPDIGIREAKRQENRAAEIRRQQMEVEARQRQRQENIIRPLSTQIEQAKQINKEFMDAANQLWNQYNVDLTHLNEMKNIKPEDVESVNRLGGGINAGDGVVLALTLKNNAQYVYKLVANEQKSEQINSVIDKIFGLNINADTIQFNNIDADALKRLGVTTNRDVLQSAIDFGGGHLQEFCEPNCLEARDAHRQRGLDLYNSDAYRGDLHRMFISDWLSGNWDRHEKNWMVTANNRAVQIDSGFGYGFAKVGGITKDVVRPPITNRGTLFNTDSSRGGADNRRQHQPYAKHLPGNSTAERRMNVQQELEAVFDYHVSTEKIDALQKAFGMQNNLEGSSIEEYKKDFMKKAGRVWGMTFDEPRPIGEVQVDYVKNLLGNISSGDDTN